MPDPAPPFTDPELVARYAERPPRQVPGFADLQRMAAILLAERTPADGRVLVLGAGGGLELKVFAEAHPGWQFDGVDPAAAMLQVAEATLGPLTARVRLHEGYIDAAPAGPYDAAACLLVLHFVPPADRVPTLRGLHQRLKPGAPLVVAHMSFPQEEPARTQWLSRYAAFSIASGIAPDRAHAASTAVAARLTILSPAEDESTLREAGFAEITQFYMGFGFRGWVAYA